MSKKSHSLGEKKSHKPAKMSKSVTGTSEGGVSTVDVLGDTESLSTSFLGKCFTKKPAAIEGEGNQGRPNLHPAASKR